MKEQLLEIIQKRQIRCVFQPIISLRDSSVLGHEVLSRGPKGSPLENPKELFYHALKYDMLWDLELVCRTKSLESAQKEQVHTKLFLNVNPNIIHDVKFKQGFTKQYLDKFSIKPDGPLLSISIAGISNINQVYSFDISRKISEVKNICKQQKGSYYRIIDL